jgi:hypothetical protein
MSQRIVTTDDHTGDEIVSEIDHSQARVGLIRDGQGYSWRNIHLSDASWNELVKIIDEFLPGITATEIDANGDPRELDRGEPSEADERSAAEDEARAALIARAADAQQTRAEAEQAQYEAQQGRAQAEAMQRAPGAPWVDAEQGTDKTSNTQLQTRAANGEMTQAQRKARSKTIRAWWYALDAKTLRALDLKTPNRSVTLGKLPPAVVAAYDAVNA